MKQEGIMGHTVERGTVHDDGHYDCQVRFDVTSLAERWQASEEQVLRIVDERAGLMNVQGVLAAGGRAYAESRPCEAFGLWDLEEVRYAESMLPEIGQGDMAAALTVLGTVLTAADALFPIPEDWRKARIDNDGLEALLDERERFIQDALEARPTANAA